MCRRYILFIFCRYKHLCRPLSWILLTSVIVLIFVLAIVLPIHLASPVKSNEDTDAYAPTDTAIISYSYSLCNKLTLNPSSPRDFSVLSTIYLLEKEPTLGKNESFNFYRESTLANNYHYWKFFLYPGSTAMYSACRSGDAGGIVFFLVKGSKNFEEWKSDNSAEFLYEATIDAICNVDTNSTHTFTASEEDNYYLIFDSDSSAPATVHITFNFERFLHDFSSDSVIRSCSITLNESKTCSVSIPMSKTTALLVLELMKDGEVEWDDKIMVDVVCHARKWVYVSITLSGIIFISVLIILSIIIYVSCIRKKREKGEENSLNGESNEDTPIFDSDDDETPNYNTYYYHTTNRPQ